MDELVERLSIGKHPVVLERQSKKMSELKQRIIELKFVMITFTNTEGGTELGINLEDDFTCLDEANFEEGRGSIHLVGLCILNFYKVRCVVDIDLANGEGVGHLELLDDLEISKVIKH